MPRYSPGGIKDEAREDHAESGSVDHAAGRRSASEGQE